jgi:tetratricopeptide (TPR) repeat protein
VPHFNRHWSRTIVLLISLSSFSSAQDAPDIRPLEQGKPIERELMGGDVHAYSVQLTVGQFLSVIFDQRGIDLVVTAFGPDSKQIARVDGPTDKQGPEAVLLAADATGSYRLEVRSVFDVAAAGRYEVKIDALRTAIPEDKKLLEIFEMDNRASLLAFTGFVQQGGGNYVEALEAYQKSIPLSEATGNKGQLVLTLNSMGETNFLQGNYPAALEAYQTSLPLSEALGYKRRLALTLNQMGRIDFLQGNYSAALERYGKTLKLGVGLGNKPVVAVALTDMSLVYRATGNFDQALNSARRGLAIHESLGNKLGAAHAQLNIGLVYSSMGDYLRAPVHFRKSLALAEELGRKPLVANALDKIGDSFNAQGDYSQALEYARRSLKLNEEIKNYRQTFFSILTIGNIHQSRGDYTQAREYYQKGLALSEKIGEPRLVADALNGIGYSYISQRNYSRALETAQRAATIAEQIGNREVLLYALNNAASSYISLNQLENARRASEQAIEIVESLRASVAGNEARAGYSASARDPYDLNVDVLMKLHKRHPSEGHDAAALQMSERGRARSLLEALNEAQADIRQGVDPTLLTSERTLQQRLNAAAERQTRLLGGKHTEEQAVGLQKEIAALTDDYEQVEEQIRRTSPRYAALTQPVPLSVREIQSDVLDAETALLEYALGAERSYLWVVTPTSVKSFELPKRAEIETGVRRMTELLGDGKRWTMSTQINAEYAAAADRLSRTLLPPALMSQLKVKRLVIVGDGALQYLPFGALPSPTPKFKGTKLRNRQQVTGDGQPLIADYEIINLPSA